MDWVVRLITDIRSARSENNVPPGAKFEIFCKDADETTTARITTHKQLISQLARVTDISLTDIVQAEGAVQIVVDEATFVLPLAGTIDVATERARLEKNIAKLEADIAKHENKLANRKFTDKAPPEVVETERERRDVAAATLAKENEALERLKAL